MTMISVSINLLKLSPKNVRQTHTDADLEEMKASLLHHGLQQNLVCVISQEDSCYYEIIAGGRRLKALQALKVEGKEVPNIRDWHIPMRQVDSMEDATELSLVENTIRTAMHPADQYEAWSELMREGKTPADISLRFGVSEHLVKQRMKLGKVAPELLQEFRDGEITLDNLVAFTVTDEHNRQLEVWRKIKNNWYQPHMIRRMLTEEAVRSDAKLAIFVGEEAYEQAGGIIARDLFEEHCYFENAALLEALALKKLEAHKAQQSGWCDIVVQIDPDQIELDGYRIIEDDYIDAPEDKVRLLDEKIDRHQQLEHGTYDEDEANEEALAAEHDQLESDIKVLQDELHPTLGWTEEQKASATLVLSVDRRGIITHTAYAPPTPSADSPDNNTAIQSYDSESGMVSELHAGDNSPASPESDAAYSQSLIADLGIYRTQMIQNAVAHDFDAAFDLMAYTLSVKLYSERWASVPLSIDISPYNDKTTNDDSGFTASGQARAALRETLNTGWFEHDDDAERFTAFCALPKEDKQALFSYASSVVINGNIYGRSHAALDLIASRLGVIPHTLWRPTESVFFKRLKKAHLLKFVGDMLGDTWLAKIADKKKGEMATWLGRVFEGNPSATSGMDGATLTAIAEWMPDEMRFDTSNVAHSTDDNNTLDHAIDDTAELPDWMCEDAA